MSVGWRLVTAPTISPLDLEMVKLHLRVEHTDDDPLIEILMGAAIEHVESRGVVLAPQTWDMFVDDFSSPIRLWKFPVQSIESVTYTDSDGASQVWDSSEYRVRLSSNPAQIELAYGVSWPTVRSQAESVAIRMNLGYYTSPFQIPYQLLGAMHLFIGHLYENREETADRQNYRLPLGIEDLIESAIGHARSY